MKFPILKELFSRVGAFVPPQTVHYLSGILNYLSVGRWVHERGLKVPIRLPGRPELYAHVAGQVAEPVTYLEFGVFEGVSMGIWSNLLKSPESRLTGFDSFEGLPENWGFFTAKEKFDVKGRIPRFDDQRVRLIKGWFDKTLPPFLGELKPHRSMIIHLDADLYSSTIFVLRQLRPFMQVGTVMVFDEFFDREHELKAFNEFLTDERIQVECIGATRPLTQVAFRIVSFPAKT